MPRPTGILAAALLLLHALAGSAAARALPLASKIPAPGHLPETPPPPNQPTDSSNLSPGIAGAGGSSVSVSNVSNVSSGSGGSTTPTTVLAGLALTPVSAVSSSSSGSGAVSFGVVRVNAAGVHSAGRENIVPDGALHRFKQVYNSAVLIVSLSEDVDGISCSARFNNDDVAVPFAKLPLHPGTDGQPVLDMAALGRSFGKTQYKVNGMVCTKSAVLSSPVVET